ncbi:MAG TPA: MBG domain-containing protein [Verrucomicrobiae bacterium]|jgi:sugar lactone lactonase YvrE
MRKINCSRIVAGIILFYAGLLPGQLIDVDFNNDSFGSSHGGPAVGPTMSGAAVIGSDGDIWNGIAADNGAAIPLSYSDGSASPVTMSFTSAGSYNVYAYSGYSDFNGTAYGALTEDYLFSGGGTQSITLSGLSTNATYTLVLYNAADTAASGRETIFTVNAASQYSVWGGNNSTLIAGVDYVEFPSAVTDPSGNLVVYYSGDAGLEGDIDGFQLQQNLPVLTVGITSPANGDVYLPPATVALTANAVFNQGPVSNVQFFINGTSLGTALTPPFIVTASNLLVGDYAFTAIASAGGILATSAVVNISVITYQTNESSAYDWTTFAGRALTGSVDGVGSAVEFSGPAGVALDTNGNLFVTDSGNNIIRKITPGGVSSTIAGFPGDSGTNDGAGAVARFYFPRAITIDSQGNLFVADTDNNRIREVTPVGTNWVVTTIAGTGSVFQGNCDSCPPSGGYVDGAGTNAQFNLPMGITVDAADNVYVADKVNNVIRKISPTQDSGWNVSTLPTTAQFESPEGLAMDSSTNFYVADTDHSEIWKLVPIGTTWSGSVLAGSTTFGTNDGTGSAARFFDPVAIAIAPGGNLFVSDSVSETIRKVTASGVVTTWAGSAYQSGSADGIGNAARFSGVAGLVVSPASTIFVADNEQIRSINSARIVQTFVGKDAVAGTNDGTGSLAQFDAPGSLVTDTSGNIYVADSGNSTIRIITSAGVVNTLAGSPQSHGTNDGTGGNAQFFGPEGLTINSGGTLYVADTGNNTIRQVLSDGVVTTICGQPGIAGSADGSGGNAQFKRPCGIAAANGALYVADTGNNTIRRITSKPHIVFPSGNSVLTWTVATIAGSAHNPLGDVDGTGSAAWFNSPQGITVDPSGNIYVADTDSEVIRKITPVGTNWVVTTIAGNSLGGFADGVGTNASFGGPVSIAVDSLGSLYVADQYGSTIRKLTPVDDNWIVSTVGGLPDTFASQDGAGAAARFDEPDGITVDNVGNIYVSDSANNSIRKGVFTAYGLAELVPTVPPVLNAALTVTLNPPEAGGQWRFPWEVSWRASGQTATNLVAGNYQVEFRAVPGWLPLPPTINVAVPGGVTTQVTNQYYPTTTTIDTNLGGSLIVNLGANPPVDAGWRFLGDTTPFLPSGFSTNLIPGTYLIEFAAASGRGNPPKISVQVQTGQTTVIDEDYPLASVPPEFAVLPELVPQGELSDLTDYPFGFNGQLQTDVGYGSGVAVETNAVLTAAHLVFNDQTLSYVSQAYWYLQREAGTYDPTPQSARGYYLLSGYAAQRTNDLQVLKLRPDASTPESRNLDVATLYFLSPVAGGGFNGYLPSDQSPNPWLTGSALKMLVGYPVDGSQFGYASIAANAGQMYQTQPQPLAFSIATDPVADQQVYTASWMFSYPGNSGGPLYVQYNGYYYPAGVYLGTLYDNNSMPISTAVRAIDSNVVSLINLAALLGVAGTNSYGTNASGGAVIIGTNGSGGGIIAGTVGANLLNNPGGLEVTIVPPAAAQAGGAWKFSNLSDADYSTKNPSTLVVTSTNAQQVVFRQIPGWNSPASQTPNVVPGAVTALTNSYTLVSSWPTPGAITYGTPLGPKQLNASIPALTNGASGTFAYNPPGGTVLPTGTNTIGTTFTPNDTVNYGTASATASVSQIVLPAPLTVTAGNLTLTYGQPKPALTGTILGLQNSDNITASYNSTATAGSAPGNYPITPSLIDPSNLETNYIVTLVPGTLTITLPVVPVIKGAAQSTAGSLTFFWSAGPNQNYQIQTTSDVSQNHWTVLATGNTGDGSPVTTTETIAANTQQYFRIVLVP